MTERQKRNKSARFGKDIADIVVGIVIVSLTVLVFLNPESDAVLFPVIFLAGSVWSLENGLDGRIEGEDRKWCIRSLFLFFSAALLFLMALLSTVSILWG